MRRTVILGYLSLLMACAKSSRAFDPDHDPACRACVASGKNFTGGQCEDSCLQDTYCYGPGNPRASQCPDDAGN